MKGVAKAVSIVTAALAGVLHVYENLVYLRLLHSLPTGLAAVSALQTEHLPRNISLDPYLVQMPPKPVPNRSSKQT